MRLLYGCPPDVGAFRDADLAGRELAKKIEAAMAAKEKGPMTIRAKMFCSEVAAVKWGAGAGALDAERVKLHAAHGAGNEEWSKATPSGNVEITITNPGAMGQFKPGMTYFVDFTPVEQ